MVFDKEAVTVSDDLLGEIKSYIDEHYVEEHKDKYRCSSSLQVEPYALAEVDKNEPLLMIFPEAHLIPTPQMAESATASKSLDDLVGNLDEAFSATLLRLIDATGKKDSEIYHRANIDRRLFSKIRSNAHYAPSKPTVLAFAVALELTLPQTEELLERAGFALTHSRKFDVIVEYFIRSRKYDVFEINEVLFSYDQPLLGGF